MSSHRIQDPACGTCGKAWYVAKTKPRREEQTGMVLQQRGLEVYLPQLSVWTDGQVRTGAARKSNSAARRGVTRVEPLFPGYLFTRMDVSSPDWVLARSAPGIAYFLGGRGSLPVPLPGELVEDIRRRAEARQQVPGPEFQLGDRVSIASGPLAGWQAVFDGTLSPSGRSRIFVQVLNRLIPVVVPAQYLRRAG